jgi:hypothetical protein
VEDRTDLAKQAESGYNGLSGLAWNALPGLLFTRLKFQITIFLLLHYSLSPDVLTLAPRRLNGSRAKRGFIFIEAYRRGPVNSTLGSQVDDA